MPLWSERLLFAIRKLIASGDIEVGSRSLTKPKFGVKPKCSPRHTLVDSQAHETEQLRRIANAFENILW
jgi:hypothetical protein